MSTAAWFHCFSGIAGDMALGALLDAGADFSEVRCLLERLPVKGWSLDAADTQRGGIGATHAVVRVETRDLPHRTLPAIESLLSRAALPSRVHARSMATFRRLADAEARIHRTTPDRVHFHEVGALDAIVDIVGTCAALEVLDVSRVCASTVAVGLDAGSPGGLVRGAHGALPNPVPASLALLKGAPVYGVDVPKELTTPTGAALLVALVEEWGALPPMTIQSVGYGAGTAESEHRPNLVQVVVGRLAEADGPGHGHGQPVVLIEANVDDVTGEVLAHTIGELLAAGAHDAWATPIVMKKGRPAHTVHALVDPAHVPAVAARLSEETGTFGLRASRSERWPVARSFARVDVQGTSVLVKLGPGRAKVEFDDAVRVAGVLGQPVRAVIAAAEAALARGEAVPEDG